MSTTLAEMVIGNPAGNVGVSGTIRYRASKDFTGLDGTKYKAGPEDYFLSNTWTVSGGLLIVPAKTGFPTTTDAQPNSALITAGIYDSRARERGTLFENFFIPATPDGPHTLLHLQTLNGRSYPIRHPETLSKEDFALMLQQAILGALAGGIPSAKGFETLVDGAATVSSAFVLSSSKILLTGQDDDVSGTLRVVNKIAGVSFDIVSDNGADSGVVAWLIYN